MGLSKKTFLYSISLAAALIGLVIGYFIFMLPSLYVDHVMKRNFDAVAEIERYYMENRSYDEVTCVNPSSTITFEIPFEGETISVAGKFFHLDITIEDEELKEAFKLIRRSILSGKHTEELQQELSKENIEQYFGKDYETLKKLWREIIKEKLLGEKLIPEDYPLRFEMKEGGAEETVYSEEYTRFHMVSDNLFVYEAGVSDGNNSYTTYAAVGKTADAYIVTIMPAMTPKMEEIRPVVVGSLPMIIAVVVLLVLLFSGIFSGRIVRPVVRLAGYARSAKEAQNFEVEPFCAPGRDEIADLAESLNELYEKLRESYLTLKEKNRMLEEENERQEVFLRASSHQLKTPIAAALLLVEGMMNEVGKYQDVKAYLPQVKKQLLSMKSIVEDILYLNHCVENMEMEEISLKELAEEVVKAYEIQTGDKMLNISLMGDSVVRGDREIVKKMIDNLVSNAVAYTPKGESIEIEMKDSSLYVRNFGVRIEDKLLGQVLEPFVSSDIKQKGKGLGLYVVSYYTKLMGGSILIENLKNGVQARLSFPSDMPKK